MVLTVPLQREALGVPMSPECGCSLSEAGSLMHQNPPLNLCTDCLPNPFIQLLSPCLRSFLLCAGSYGRKRLWLHPCGEHSPEMDRLPAGGHFQVSGDVREWYRALCTERRGSGVPGCRARGENPAAMHLAIHLQNEQRPQDQGLWGGEENSR